MVVSYRVSTTAIVIASLPIFACGGSIGDAPQTRSGGTHAGGAASVTAGGTVSTGGTTVALPADKTLEALSSDDATQLSQEIKSQIDTQLAAVPLALRCHYAAVLQGSYIAGAGASGTSDEVKRACASSEARCTEQNESSYIASTPLHPARFENVDSFSQCSANVGEYRTCAADLTQAETDVMTALPACDTLDVDSYPGGLGTVPVELDVPSSCETLYSTCPRLDRRRQD